MNTLTPERNFYSSYCHHRDVEDESYSRVCINDMCPFCDDMKMIEKLLSVTSNCSHKIAVTCLRSTS